MSLWLTESGLYFMYCVSEVFLFEIFPCRYVIVSSFYLTGLPIAFQSMLSSSASAAPAVLAGEYVSSLPPSVASPSGYPPGHDPALVARYVLVLFFLSCPVLFLLYFTFLPQA